jgi:hypothetical protein
MPAQDGLRPNDLSQIEQVRHEPGHPYKQNSVASAYLKPMRRTAQSNIELMPKKEVLDLKLPPGSE